MKSYRSLEVFLGSEKVGTLARTRDAVVAFEYSESWLNNGFSLSPFSLPLRKQVFVPKFDPFDGLFGAFVESLPDSWGRLLVDRMLLREGEDPQAVDSLNRLAIVGRSGMGALTYRPTHDLPNARTDPDYDRLSEECRRLLKTDLTDDLDELFLLGGSSGGARPKILTEVDGEPWIVKFPSSQDRDDVGLMEYKYSLCAKACGIDMAETRLFPSKRSAGFFGTKRFDRRLNATTTTTTVERIPMLSVSAILETSHRVPNLDYHTLMKLTLKLTQDFNEVEKLYRRMCFNVAAHNRDDHSKNFSFLYDLQQQHWLLSPAYDLTYSHSVGGEHATSVNGNGRDPGMEDILAVAVEVKLGKEKARHIAREIDSIVREELGGLKQALGLPLRRN